MPWYVDRCDRFGGWKKGSPKTPPPRHKRPRSPEMSDSISYTIRDEAKDMDEKENECVAREAYAKSVDQQYKSKIQQYKRSKDCLLYTSDAADE